MPKVTVDGQEIEVPDGATVLQACELAGKERLGEYGGKDVKGWKKGKWRCQQWERESFVKMTIMMAEMVVVAPTMNALRVKAKRSFVLAEASFAL